MGVDTLNVYVCGVGGFGIGSVTRILTMAAQLTGRQAIGSETHGLAQRGGVVVSTLRIGSEIMGSPLIINGAADVVIALEPLEALRALPCLKGGGTVIYNSTRFQPLSVRLGQERYPSAEDILAQLRRVTESVIPVDASGIAKRIGLAQAANVVLLGALMGTARLPFDQETMRQAVELATPARFIEANRKALEEGYQAVIPQEGRTSGDARK
jgi:indolepyruvate ferredoxin oxidoreductase beta subunit